MLRKKVQELVKRRELSCSGKRIPGKVLHFVLNIRIFIYIRIRMHTVNLISKFYAYKYFVPY